MFNPDIHHRHSIRLQQYNYAAAGAYFVTICAHERQCLFGQICDWAMHMSTAGRMVESLWLAMPGRFPLIALDEYVIMPNHFHGIVVMHDVGAPLAAPGFDVNKGNKQGAASSAPTLGNIMRVFKSMAAIEVNRVLDRHGQPLWQRNYYERVIRDDEELTAIREYIAGNPASWAEDKENPDLM